MRDITQILEAIESADPHAANELLPLVYDELRRLAESRMRQESPDHTLEPTALVHEAYIRLVGSADPGWQNRGHFFAAAAEAMRRILVESARHKASLKAGGDRLRIDLSRVFPATATPDERLLALHEALEKLEALDPRKSALVKLRFFAGLTNPQAAAMLGISTSTADNDWAYARSWLRIEMSENAGGKKTFPSVG